MKSGVVGGERTSKLNELIRIGEQLGTSAKMAAIRP
jgi:enolase